MATTLTKVIVLAPRYMHAETWARKEGLRPGAWKWGSSENRLYGFTPTGPDAPRVVRIHTDQPLQRSAYWWLQNVWLAHGGAVEDVSL